MNDKRMILMEPVCIEPKERKLKTGWKSWHCPKCGDGWLYRGRRPPHKKCPGKFQFCNMMSKESEGELIECMAEEIKKEIQWASKKHY